MSRALDRKLRGRGTKFRLFAQPPFLPGYGEPETVWVSSPAGSLGAGPQDHRMYVVDPLEEKPYYEDPFSLPFKGACHPPARPGPGGHFDHLDKDSRDFRSAHMFGAVRRVLDIWEGLFPKPYPLAFPTDPSPPGDDSLAQLEQCPVRLGLHGNGIWQG